MANLNKVFLIGRLTQDPELRYTASQIAVSDLRLAVNRVSSSREGETREETLYIDVTVWNRQAQNCVQYLKKGRQVHVEGFIRMETWEDKTSGQQRSKLKVIAENVQFLDSIRRGEDAGPSDAAEPSTGPTERPAMDYGNPQTAEGPYRSSSTAPVSNPSRSHASPPISPAMDGGQEPGSASEDIPF